MPAPAWAAAMLQACHVRTREELESFLRRPGVRLFELAQKHGWVLKEAPYPERGHHVYSPGALRRATLALPVYQRCDTRKNGDYDALGLRLKLGDAQDQNPARDNFLRTQLLAYFDPASPGVRPAPLASAAIVVADDGQGVWWPARLCTPAENEWFRKETKIRKKGGVCVAVLCYDGKEGLSFYDVVKACHRVTQAELKEMYELSLAEHNMHPDAAGAAVTGTRHTHRRTFKRRQRQEQFRAAVAFALALDRIVPEARRYVPLTAPCANDASVPQFTTPQLENPLTPQVAADPALAFALDSLRTALKTIQESEARAEEQLAAQEEAEGDEEEDEGTDGSGSDGAEESAATAATSAAAMMMPAPVSAAAASSSSSNDRRVKPRTGVGPSLQPTTHRNSHMGGGGGSGGGGAPRVVHALLLPEAAAAAHHDNHNHHNLDDGELLHAPGGAAGGADDDESSHATDPVPSDEIPPSLGDGGLLGGLGAGGSSIGSGSSGGSGSSSGSGALSPAAQLVVAFERLMGLVGMQGEAGSQGKLDRFRRAAFALARAGGGGEFVAAMTEATAAFHDLWVTASDRLRRQKRAQPQAQAQAQGALLLQQAAGDRVRACLEGIGLGNRTAEVLAAGGVEPLRRRLARLLTKHLWAEGELESKGRELRQAQATAAQSVAWFESALRAAPVGTTNEFRAAATLNVANFRKRVHDVQGAINAHDEAMRLRRAIADVGALVAAPLPQEQEQAQGDPHLVAALNENHEARIFELWGNLMIAASARQHGRGGGGGAGGAV